MNTRNLVVASLIGAVVTTALTSIPFVNLLICVVCLPLWGGPLLATWYYKRETGVMPMNHALAVGTVTGLLAGIFGAIVGLIIGPAASAAMLDLARQIAPPGTVIPTASDAGMTVLGMLGGVVFSTIFGLIGGAIGGAVFKDKSLPPAPPVA